MSEGRSKDSGAVIKMKSDMRRILSEMTIKVLSV